MPMGHRYIAYRTPGTLGALITLLLLACAAMLLGSASTADNPTPAPASIGKIKYAQTYSASTPDYQARWLERESVDPWQPR